MGTIRMAGHPRPRGKGGASTLLSSFVVVVEDAPPNVVAAIANNAPLTAQPDAQAHVRERAYIPVAGQCRQGNNAGLLTLVSYGGGFGGGRSTLDVKAALALLLSSLLWLEPPPLLGRRARDNDNGKVDKVDVVGVDRQRPVGIRMAGGWVHDKLLNQLSANVNRALDCMMKVQFARIVQRYMALLLSS